MYALHFTDTWAGRVFSQSEGSSALALPVYTATAIGSAAIGACPILNPSGSGVNLELMNIHVAWVSGTSSFGAIGLMMGYCSGIAAGQVCTALAATTAVNGNLGMAGGSKVISSNAGTVTVGVGTAAPPVPGGVVAGWFRSIGSINIENSTTTPMGTIICNYDFGGTCLIAPGTIIYMAATIATTALYVVTITWKEIPITGR